MEEKNVSSLISEYNKKEEEIVFEGNRKKMRIERIKEEMEEMGYVPGRSKADMDSLGNRSPEVILEEAEKELEEYEAQKEKRREENLNGLIESLQELNTELKKEVMELKKAILQNEIDLEESKTSKDSSPEKVLELMKKSEELKKMLEDKTGELEKCKIEIEKRFEERDKNKNIHSVVEGFHELSEESRGLGTTEPEEIKPSETEPPKEKPTSEPIKIKPIQMEPPKKKPTPEPIKIKPTQTEPPKKKPTSEPIKTKPTQMEPPKKDPIPEPLNEETEEVIVEQIDVFFDAKTQKYSAYKVEKGPVFTSMKPTKTIGLKDIITKKEFKEFYDKLLEKYPAVEGIDPYLAYVINNVGNYDRVEEYVDSIKNEEKSENIHIVYHMDGIYGRKYSPELSSEIMEYANTHEEKELATVNKGFITRFLEKNTWIRKGWEGIKSVLNKNNTPLLPEPRKVRRIISPRSESKPDKTSFVPTYSKECMQLLEAKSYVELRAILDEVDTSKLSQEEKTAIGKRMEELYAAKVKAERDEPKKETPVVGKTEGHEPADDE